MASLVVSTAPATEPVSSTEAKLHLRVDTTADDTLITSVIKSARQWVERYCRRGIITQTVRLRFDGFPSMIRLPWGKCASVTSIVYVDGDGAEQTLSTANYQVDLDSVPARIIPAYSYSWPVTRDQMAAVTVTYVVGAATADDDIRGAILLMVGDLYENREASIIAASYAANPTVQALLMPHRCDLLGASLEQ